MARNQLNNLNSCPFNRKFPFPLNRERNTKSKVRSGAQHSTIDEQIYSQSVGTPHSTMRSEFHFILLAVAVISFILLLLIRLEQIDLDVLSDQIRFAQITKEPQIDASQTAAPKSLRWIVITSIAHKPTDSIKALSLEAHWSIVIVGDAKGPHDPVESEWNALPRVTVLTIEQQQALNYRILTVLPKNSYTRKMIGYLYAIERGAEVIYDTDDDNKPIYKGLEMFDYDRSFTGMLYSKQQQNTSLFNPYAYFGRPDIWPRGYPLTSIQVANNRDSFHLCRNLAVPLVQQGLVERDPDVDAIFRLIHAHPRDGLNEAFSPHAPPIAVDRDVFTPFNSQNTLFHYDAFFTLALPIGVAFRVTDIWRGYFSQTLIHAIGGRIGFYPVNAVQHRNPHSYLADFKDETALYHDADRMVDELSGWICTQRTTEKCTLELSRLFMRKSFWTAEDHALIEAWIEDLNAIGYKFPLISESITAAVECHLAPQDFKVESTEAIGLKQRANYVELADWCEQSPISELFGLKPKIPVDLAETLKKIVLVISFNYAIPPASSIHSKLYQGFFAHVLFCGTLAEDTFSQGNATFPEFSGSESFIFASVEEIKQGYLAYFCTAKAIELRLQNIQGYITVADDTLFNMWNNVDYTRFQADDNTIISDSRKNWSWWWEPEIGKDAILNATDYLRTAMTESPDSSTAKAMREFDKLTDGNGFKYLEFPYDWMISDWYYLPESNAWVFAELANVFHRFGVFHELAVPRLGTAFGHKDVFIDGQPSGVPHTYVWTEDRNHLERFYKLDIVFMHPFKVSLLANETFKKMACEHIIKPYSVAVWFGIN